MSGLRLVDGGRVAIGTDPDLEAHMAWARDLRGLTPATLRAREWVLHRLAQHVRVPLREVSQAHLLDWERIYVAGLAAQSRRTYICHVESFYGWLMQTKVISENPTMALTRPKIGKRLPRPISEADLRRALGRANPKIAAMMTLMAYGGLRAMEARNCNGRTSPPPPTATRCCTSATERAPKTGGCPVGKVVLNALHVYGTRTRGSVCSSAATGAR